MRITFADAQRNVSEIANREAYTMDVIYELLAAYGRSASAITKLRSGTLNLAVDKENEVLQRGVVYFKHAPEGNLLSLVDSLDQDPLVVRYNPRYLIVTDYDRLVAKDTKKDTTLDIMLRDIDRSVDFFYGWTGDEVTSEKTEAIADRRAADKMKDLYAEIERVNREKLADSKSTFRHDLNVFFSRLLFCFFAEDTKVFSKSEKTMFTSSIKDYTQTDGSDLDTFLDTLFNALDTNDKSSFTSPFSKFPYVNGTIFDTKKHNIAIPKFNAQARKLMLDCGNLNWSAINPDIFGSMFQSIVDEEHRSNHGMHYTSVPNIMKTIEPLFLDELREEFDKHYDDPKKLNKLWDRISKIKVFDPACGSGNFLIIAYKELRKIEHGIIDRLFSDDYKRAALSGRLESRIKLDNFYGIEIDDFAHEIAILSLYLAKHQMNIEFEEHFGKEIILIPLKDNANIIRGNAARINWQEVCPNVGRTQKLEKAQEQSLLIEFEDPQPELELGQQLWDEIYLISNPPYAGARKQDSSQKQDLDRVFHGLVQGHRNMDYVTIWFYKAAEWLAESNRAAFSLVSTNSVSQGQQIPLLWPLVFKLGLRIDYAYTSFKWQNSAKDNAGITCVIIAMSKRDLKHRFIESNFVRESATEITAYLKEKTHDTLIPNRTKPISELPKLDFGNMPLDGGNLLMTTDEMANIVNAYPEANKYIKRIVGAKEYIHDIDRWCIWIEDHELDEALKIEPIAERIKRTEDFRLASKDKGTQKKASKAHQFREMRTGKVSNLILPAVTSEQRQYLISGILQSDVIISNRAYMVPDPELWVLAIIMSKNHMAWTSYVSGKLELRINYSSGIVYNNYPLPSLLPYQKEELAGLARNVLFARENHSENNLAELYDPKSMPDDLREAHYKVDMAVDRLYRSKPYANDDERLADLFSLYEQMTANEKEKSK